jgi:hypothetical protein
VVAHLVPLGDQPAHHLLVAGDVLANHEKGGASVMLGQDVQDARRRRGVRAVVECQGDEGPRVGLLEQDVRESPAEPANHGAGPEQRRDDDREQTQKVGESPTHDL